LKFQVKLIKKHFKYLMFGKKPIDSPHLLKGITTLEARLDRNFPS